MLKRKWMLGTAVTSLFFSGLSMPASASSACGGDPLIMPGDLSSPASGPVIKAWTLNCDTDSGHRGVDIDVPAGASITAAADGIVTFVGFTPAEGGGNTVAITHGNELKSTYLHLSNVTVREGTMISRGDTIGASDGTPLHFGIKLVGTRDIYYDPTPFLNNAAASQPTSGETPEQNESQVTSNPVAVIPADPSPDATLTAEHAPATVTNAFSTNPAFSLQPRNDYANQYSRVNLPNTSIAPATDSPMEKSANNQWLTNLPSVADPVLNLRSDLKVREIPANNDYLKSASGQYRQSKRGASLPYRSSILPLAAVMIITALMLQGRRTDGLRSAPRTA